MTTVGSKVGSKAGSNVGSKANSKVTFKFVCLFLRFKRRRNQSKKIQAKIESKKIAFKKKSILVGEMATNRGRSSNDLQRLVRGVSLLKSLQQSLQQGVNLENARQIKIENPLSNGPKKMLNNQQLIQLAVRSKLIYNYSENEEEEMVKLQKGRNCRRPG